MRANTRIHTLTQYAHTHAHTTHTHTHDTHTHTHTHTHTQLNGLAEIPKQISFNLKGTLGSNDIRSMSGTFVQPVNPYQGNLYTAK